MSEPASSYPPLSVKAWGKMACFTRPEAKAERVSYPVMTPSAARGVLEAIYWKPQFHYRVREIVVLSPIRYASLLRNEVDSKMSPRSDGISITDARQQRHTLALRGAGAEDVAYIIRADVIPAEGVDTTESDAKFRAIFRRRVERGERFQQPFFGCREFACDFAEPDGKERPPAELRAKSGDNALDLGLMLLDIAFSLTGSGVNIPYFWQAKLDGGVLRVPDIEYQRMEELRLP